MYFIRLITWYRESVTGDKPLSEIKFNLSQRSIKPLNEIETTLDDYTSPVNLRKSYGIAGNASPKQYRPYLQLMRPSQSVKSLNTHRVKDHSVCFEDESTNWGGKTSTMVRYKSTMGFGFNCDSPNTAKFKALKVPTSHNVPFMVMKSTKPLTQGKEIPLETKKRSVSRIKEWSCCREKSCPRNPSKPQKKPKQIYKKSIKYKEAKKSKSRLFHTMRRSEVNEIADTSFATLAQAIHEKSRGEGDPYSTLLAYLQTSL